MSPAPDRPSITVTQVVASALAASSAAFAASYLGVAGTIIGAAVASVVATVASTMYTASFQHSSAVVRRRITPEPEVDREEDDPHPSWRRTALTAAAVLAITLGSVTAVEAVLGKPLSGVLGGSDSSGTSISRAVTSGSESNAPEKERRTSTPSPTPDPASGSTSGSTPTPTPTDQPTDQPSSTPTAEPTEPSGTPTATDSPTPADAATP